MSSDFAERIAALRRADAAFNLLQTDIVAEKAASLGHQGRQMEKALRALREFDANGGGSAEARLRLVKAAARDVWSFLVQRELCGLRDQKQVVAEYAIPGEVLVRLGAVDRD